jgi:predicted DNA-binding protein
MDKKDWIVRSIMLRPQQNQKLEEFKKKSGIPISQIIRTAISKLIQENKD